MAKAAFTLDKVRQEILTSSLARTNRFEVLITPPIGLKGDYKSDFISMYVEQASLPALNIFSKSFKISTNIVFFVKCLKPLPVREKGVNVTLLRCVSLNVPAIV